MTTLNQMLGRAAHRSRPGRWAALCAVLFCLGFAFQVPSATRAASPSQDATATPLPSPTPTCEQRCDHRAEEVYKACIATGREAEACRKEASTAREICMRDCPRPTATPSCQDRCKAHAEEVFKACIAAGRGEDACHREANDALEACLKECPKPEPTATKVLTCEQRCQARFEEVYKACIAAGRGPDACEAEAKVARDACIRENCPRQDATKTPKPEEPTCEQRCKARFEEVYKACIAAGRGPDVCEAEAKVARDACLKELCPRPSATPGCEQRCQARFEEVLKACLAAGRGEEACKQEATAAREACIKERCPRDATKTPGPDQPNCEQRCKARYEEVYKACIAAGRGPDACEAEAKVAREACMKELCPHPTATPGCERQCQARFEEVLKACLAAGRGEEACKQEATAAREACIKERCPRDATKTPGPDQPNCEQRCKARYEEVYKACIAAGRGPDACEAEAKTARQACMRELCPNPDKTKTPQPVSCEGRCKDKAEAEFKACRDGGGDEKTCHERANKVLQDCMANCPKPTPAPQGCRERCTAKAEAAYRACLADGGGEDRCFDVKTKTFNECFTACEHPTESCESGCKRRAEALLKQCLAEGGTEAACRERMHSALDVCLKSCPRPEPVDCQDRCAQSARALLAKCVADGGGQADCEAKAKEAYNACVKHCDRPVPPAPITDCSTKCARAGVAVFQKCLAEGGGVEDCTERMAQAIQSCLTECLRPGAVAPPLPPADPTAKPEPPAVP